MEWIRGFFLLFKQYRKQKKIDSDLNKAKKHAILALAYWKDCSEESDLHFQIQHSNTYVRLGKGMFEKCS